MLKCQLFAYVYTNTTEQIVSNKFCILLHNLGPFAGFFNDLTNKSDYLPSQMDVNILGMTYIRLRLHEYQAWESSSLRYEVAVNFSALHQQHVRSASNFGRLSPSFKRSTLWLLWRDCEQAVKRDPVPLRNSNPCHPVSSLQITALMPK